MIIAVIAADLIPDRLGGAEAHVVEVIKKLSSKHKFLVFVGEDTSSKKLFNKNVQVFPTNYPKISNLKGLSYIIFAYRQIINILKNQKFDLIWAKQSFPQAPLGAMLKKKFNKHLYITAQNPMLHKEELFIKGKILKPFQEILVSLLTPLISWSFSQADLVACVSNYSAKKAVKLGAEKIRVIPNGIAVARFKKSKINKNKGFTRIVTTSALIPRNGLDTLIEATSFLPRGIKWKLEIAGDGPEKKKLSDLVESAKLKSKITFVGRINNRDIPKFLAQADIFVRLSRKEGFGVSFLEAMAAGVPVIATSVGGIVDFVEHKKTGLLVKPDDPTDALDALLMLIDNNRLRKKLVSNAADLVNKKYNWNNISDEIAKEFNKLS